MAHLIYNGLLLACCFIELISRIHTFAFRCILHFRRFSRYRFSCFERDYALNFLDNEMKILVIFNKQGKIFRLLGLFKKVHNEKSEMKMLRSICGRLFIQQFNESFTFFKKTLLRRKFDDLI